MQVRLGADGDDWGTHHLLNRGGKCKIQGQPAPDQVAIGDDPDEPAIVDDGERAHARLIHDHGRVANGKMWPDRLARPAYPIDGSHRYSSVRAGALSPGLSVRILASPLS